MIYSFDTSDPNTEKFLALLRKSNIDYDVIQHDGIVIHILGDIDHELQQKLKSYCKGRKPDTNLTNTPFVDFTIDGAPVIIAGPCAVESEEQIKEVTSFLAEIGVRYVRGGAFKPRTSPDSFQGTGERGLKLLSKYAEKHNLKIVTEVMDRSQIELVRRYADILQVGSRNMANYSLLIALGALDKPILLKRGMAATIEEWVSAARYISKGGNHSIILCERGIRTFEPATRNTLDVAAIPLAKQITGYPVIADPSHAAGRADLVPSLTMAALAAGADGVIVEVHPNPAQALSDSKQALTLSQLKELVEKIREFFGSNRKSD